MRTGVSLGRGLFRLWLACSAVWALFAWQAIPFPTLRTTLDLTTPLLPEFDDCAPVREYPAQHTLADEDADLQDALDCVERQAEVAEAMRFSVGQDADRIAVDARKVMMQVGSTTEQLAIVEQAIGIERARVRQENRRLTCRYVSALTRTIVGAPLLALAGGLAGAWVARGFSGKALR